MADKKVIVKSEENRAAARLTALLQEHGLLSKGQEVVVKFRLSVVAQRLPALVDPVPPRSNFRTKKQLGPKDYQAIFGILSGDALVLMKHQEKCKNRPLSDEEAGRILEAEYLYVSRLAHAINNKLRKRSHYRWLEVEMGDRESGRKLFIVNEKASGRLYEVDGPITKEDKRIIRKLPWGQLDMPIIEGALKNKTGVELAVYCPYRREANINQIFRHNRLAYRLYYRKAAGEPTRFWISRVKRRVR